MATDGGSLDGPGYIFGFDVTRKPTDNESTKEDPVTGDVKKGADIPSDTVIETKHLFSDPTIKYHLIEELGGGSEGSVYKAVAEDSSGSKRVVAFKEFHNVPNDEQRRHLEREMQLRQQLTGVSGIASYITHGYTAGKKLRFALVSEYIEGTTLEHIVQPGKDFAGKQFTEEEAKHFLYQALTCVGEFHKRDIIHRDIKPSNILITEKGVQFPDLGLVCDASRSTLTATVAGSPDYVAPEQIFKKPVPASDIYSLGFVMQFVMAGEQPNIPFNRLLDVDNEDFDFTSLMQRGYSQNFVGIIEKMCQKNVQRRYATVDDVLHDIEIGRVTLPLVKLDKRTLQRKTADAITTYISASWDFVKKVWHAIPYASLSTGQYGMKIALRNKAENFSGVSAGLWDSNIEISKGISFALWENAIEKDGYGVQLAGFGNVTDQAYGLQLAGFLNGAFHDMHGVQLAGLINSVNYCMYGVQLSGLMNEANHDMYGVQLAVLSNWNNHNMHGVQFVGIANLVDNAYGMQLAGVMNGVEHAYGVQLAGVWNFANHDMHGVQLAGVWNFANHDVYGVQVAGFVNGVEHAYGVQLAGIMNGTIKDMHGVQLAGVMNLADNAYGVQASGAVNISLEELVGIQIAPICYANHGKYLQFGLLTIRGNDPWYKSLIPITGWSPLIGWRWEKKS